MKIQITGASNFVNRMFQACGPYQWSREFLTNAREAGATRIEFGFEWQAIQAEGVYRRTVMDDGCGMDASELQRFFSTLGDGAKQIGGVHDNFGVGAKIASLPWNPKGVVVMSWKEGEASMIWIRLDPDSGDYELRDFENDRGIKNAVVNPELVDWAEIGQIDWAQVKPDWIDKHGTVIVLLGSDAHPDTVLGNPDAYESKLKGLALYLNSRFWDLDGTNVNVAELKSERRQEWPVSEDETGKYQARRSVFGAKYYLTDVNASSGELGHSDVMLLDEDRVAVSWYLWNGDRPKIGPYAQQNGYIAVKYGDELFHLTNSKIHFRWFGIVESEVQRRTTIVLEPQLLGSGKSKWGIHPDQSRNRLIFTGAGESAVDVPLDVWGMDFREEMPAPIEEAIRAARGDLDAELEDGEYRKRLQDKFGSRWRTRRLVASSSPSQEKASISNDYEDVLPTTNVDEENPDFDTTRLRNDRTLRVKRKKAAGDGLDDAEFTESPVDVPNISFNKKEDFEKEWHIAAYAKSRHTVMINLDSGIIDEVVKYHEERYPEILHEEVRKIIWKTFGEVAACKVAHSQKLARMVTEQELDKSYRTEEALTVGLMGLMAEESLISQRLGRLGRKKPVEA